MQQLSVEAVAEAAIFHRMILAEGPYKFGPMEEMELAALAESAMSMFDAYEILQSIREMDDTHGEMVIHELAAMIWAHGLKTAASVALTPVK